MTRLFCEPPAAEGLFVCIHCGRLNQAVDGDRDLVPVECPVRLRKLIEDLESMLDSAAEEATSLRDELDGQ